MKLLQKHYLFILVIALLSLLLGISFVEFSKKETLSGSGEYNLYIQATIKEKFLCDEVYQDDITIYGAYPSIKLSLMQKFLNVTPSYSFLSTETKYDSPKFLSVITTFTEGQGALPDNLNYYAQVEYSFSHPEYYDVSIDLAKILDAYTKEDFKITSSGE